MHVMQRLVRSSCGPVCNIFCTKHFWHTLQVCLPAKLSAEMQRSRNTQQRWIKSSTSCTTISCHIPSESRSTHSVRSNLVLISMEPFGMGAALIETICLLLPAPYPHSSFCYCRWTHAQMYISKRLRPFLMKSQVCRRHFGLNSLSMACIL